MPIPFQPGPPTSAGLCPLHTAGASLGQSLLCPCADFSRCQGQSPPSLLQQGVGVRKGREPGKVGWGRREAPVECGNGGKRPKDIRVSGVGKGVSSFF
jgi:hypothetical protein